MKRQGISKGWIPIEEATPKTDDYIFVSFDNWPLPDIGRYEEDGDGGGSFYPGDEDKTYLAMGMIPNAWQPMIQNYNEEEE